MPGHVSFKSQMPLIELVKLIFDDIEISCRHPNRQSGHKFQDFLDKIGGITFGHRECGSFEVLGTTKLFSVVPHSSVACGCINLVWHPGGWLFDGWWSGPLDSAMNLTPTTSVWCTPPNPYYRKKVTTSSTFIINDSSTCVSGSASFVAKQFYLLLFRAVIVDFRFVLINWGCYVSCYYLLCAEN